MLDLPDEGESEVIENEVDGSGDVRRLRDPHAHSEVNIEQEIETGAVASGLVGRKLQSTTQVCPLCL